MIEVTFVCRIGSGKLANPSWDAFWDKSAFKAPAPYAFGNAGRNILIRSGLSNWDIALYFPQALKGDLAYYHRMGVPAITTFGVITGRDYFASHVSPAAFLYPQLLWNAQRDPREMMRDSCTRFFGSEQAREVFDLLSRADQMVYVERYQLQARKAGDHIFLESVS